MACGEDFDMDGWNYKRISATKLIELLQKLPPSTDVCCNRVQNLSVHRSDGTQFGYIDVGNEELDLYPQNTPATPVK